MSGEFDVLRTAAAAMDAERSALDLAAHNVAAATVAGGTSFDRLVPKFAVGAPPSEGSEAASDGAPAPPDAPLGATNPGDRYDAPAVRYLGARVQHRADVDAVTEMVAVLDAQRGFEAGASVFDAGKRLAERTLDLGRAS